MQDHIEVDERVERILAGDRRAITRTISLIENGIGAWEEIVARLYKWTGKGYRIGITGPPGAGKSTLTKRLIAAYRGLGLKIAVIAIDPTSPFTGGAILGDRIRMQSESMWDNVFVRSMASRGSLGGLSTRAQDVADLLDAAGFDVILFETVGVGQSELDIARASDSTVVVLVPESGDAIQAMKSGLMEIADVFVLNKSDRDGSDQAVAALMSVLSFRITHSAGEWIPPVVKAVATDGAGLDLLVEAIQSHRIHLEQEGDLKARRLLRERQRTIDLAERLLQSNFWSPERLKLLEVALHDLAARVTSPLQVARRLVG